MMYVPQPQSGWLSQGGGAASISARDAHRNHKTSATTAAAVGYALEARCCPLCLGAFSRSQYILQHCNASLAEELQVAGRGPGRQLQLAENSSWPVLNSKQLTLACKLSWRILSNGRAEKHEARPAAEASKQEILRTGSC